ncbi:ABC transporter ATP-binding protein [Bacillus dakarensis]|uniref:ABC transporter ATP-binding protein n=1 Tax=Robertmurraya dakarensis TaxID=1926278 RepID=UPI000981B2FC|nr:dipeptide ABC transporter ATP-binding protein [Bacillus dakarensis]
MLASTLETSDVLLQVNGLKKYYFIREGIFGGVTGSINAVDDISFTVKKGETFSIVGESGCGKSTTGKCLVRIEDPTSGSIVLNNKNITSSHGKELLDLRRNIQMIFQDPYSSLNPKHTIRESISEPLVNFRIAKGAELEKKLTNLMEIVGLSPKYLDRYPHEFSGGQRQRIGIARALAVNPELIICDEPVSALDVSIQSQILNLLKDLQQEFQLTYIFISHDLSVVHHISDRVAVMYLGRIVEMGSKTELFNNPKHPYTKALLSSIPIANPDIDNKQDRIILNGDVPSPRNPPNGCYFHTRCPYKKEQCENSYPDFTSISETHKTACFYVNEI